MDKLTVTPVSAGIATAVVLITVAYLAYLTVPNEKAKGAEDKKPLKLPLIGDLHKSPIDKPLLNWDAWAAQNGPLPTPKLFGIVPMVVINTSEAVIELFSRRSQYYSNRPPSVTMEMITNAGPGKSRFTLMHDYDDHLKLHHRLLSPSLGVIASPQYQPLMELETAQLLNDVLGLVTRNLDNVVSTADVYPLLERTQTSVMLSLHYGLRIPVFEEPIMHEVIHIQQQVTHRAANPGLPDMLPVLRHLPDFLSPWKKDADRLYQEQLQLYMRLYNHGKNCSGWNATKQALSVAKTHAGPAGVPDVDLAFTLATSIQGGMETSPRQILWLFVAGLVHSGWWAKAQAVVDKVVGRERLPQFSDRAKLAYTDAVAHELFRWRPIAPGTIPRRAEKADEWNGVKIAKGAVLIGNAWGIGRDTAVFDPALGDPAAFVPERWLAATDGKGGETKLRTDLPLPVFGQGRRMCLGKKIAVDGTFILVTRLLWAFDVMPVEDVDPMAMDVIGFMTVPKTLRFKLKPRGPWVDEVIAKEWTAVDTSLDKVMGTTNDIES
jgi:cytochrome P450